MKTIKSILHDLKKSTGKNRKVTIIVPIIIGLSVIFCAAIAQNPVTQKNNGPDKKDSTVVSSTNPKIDIKINKQYDDQGNIIGYDTSYTYIVSARKRQILRYSRLENSHLQK